MMSLETIKSEERKRAREAKAKNTQPYLIESEEQKQILPFPFPFIGYFIPDGWVKVEEYFVDCSGFGAEDELALTTSQFIEKLKVGRGYAITRAGQFQVYVGEYIKKSEG